MIKFEKTFLTINEKIFEFEFPVEKVVEFEFPVEKVVEFEFPVEKVVEFDSIYLILFDPNSKSCDFGQFSNLIGLDYDKEIIWVAELPTTDTGDCYHSLDIVNQKIVAYSWRSYQCIIDSLSGKITKKTFTK